MPILAENAYNEKNETIQIDAKGSFITARSPPSRSTLQAQCVTRLYERLEPIMSHLMSHGLQQTLILERFSQLMIKIENFIKIYLKNISQSYAKLIQFHARKLFFNDFILLNLEIREFYDSLGISYSLDKFRKEDLQDQRQIFKIAFTYLLNDLKGNDHQEIMPLSQKEKKKNLLTELQTFPAGIILFLSLNKYIALSVKERQILNDDVMKLKETVQNTFLHDTDSKGFSQAGGSELDEILSVSTVNEVLGSVSIANHSMKTSDTFQNLKEMYFQQAKLPMKHVQKEKDLDANSAIGILHRRHKVFLKRFPFPSSITRDSKQRQIIEQEILLLKFLGNYPTILNCYGYIILNESSTSRNSEFAHIVYELAPYGSLAKILSANKVQSLPLSLLTAWLSDLADAMQFLHNKGVVHGDIKAENVLVFEGLQSKLSNFQSSKMVNRTAFVGSPRSLPPSSQSFHSRSGIDEVSILEPTFILQQTDDISTDLFHFLHYALFTLLAAASPNYVPCLTSSIPDQIEELFSSLLLSSPPNSATLVQGLKSIMIGIDANTMESEEIATQLEHHIKKSCGGDPREPTHPEYRDIQIIEALLPLVNPTLETELMQLSLNDRISRIRNPPSLATRSLCSSTSSSTASKSTAVLSLDFLRYSVDQSLQEAEDRNKLAEFFRTKLHFTNPSAIETSRILMKNGIYSERHLQSKLLPKVKKVTNIRSDDGFLSPIGSVRSFSQKETPTWEILVDFGVDPEIALDLYEYFHSVNGLVPSPSSMILSSPASSSSITFNDSFASSSLGNVKSILPSEIARLYAAASQASNKTALAKLETLANNFENPYNYYLANGFLMRMYVIGQGHIKRDRIQAEKLSTIVAPWLQQRVLAEYEVARMYIQFLLGVCYSEGLGDLPVDLNESIRWYRASADQDGAGYSAAQAYLGYCYFKGLGVQKDYAISMKYYMRAALQGHAGAQCNIGMCYEKGYGVPKKNRKEALRWFQLAADQSDASGLFNVAYYFEKGYEVPQNWSKAFEFYLQSAEENHMVAKYNVGCCYYLGNGVNQDLEEAFRWFQAAADQKYAPAQCKVGLCYEQGHGTTKDYLQAVEWYKKSSEQGDAAALYYLGYCYYNGWGVEVSYDQAVQYYHLSAKKKHPAALNNLGFCYFHGRGVQKDLARAAEYYRRSANLGYAPAQFNMGYCYERGYGVPKKLNLVIRYYRLAAEQGNQYAKQALVKYL